MFERLDPYHPEQRPTDGRQRLSSREIPSSLHDHDQSAPNYRPDPALVAAVNVALATGHPLLVTGEPGCGKTQLAAYLAWYFDCERHTFTVRSTSAARDLLYRYDRIAYWHAANDPALHGQQIDRTDPRYLEQGPLWRAYVSEAVSVVLIDEIDKAPRDFPNDLLDVLDQHRFACVEASIDGKPLVISRDGRPPPVIIVTSNNERTLPDAFLRRCIYHHIELTEEHISRAVAAHRGQAFPTLPEPVVAAALSRFWQLRRKSLRKPPATAELITWLTILAASGETDAAGIESKPEAELPAMGALIKDHEDCQVLGLVSQR